MSYVTLEMSNIFDDVDDTCIDTLGGGFYSLAASQLIKVCTLFVKKKYILLSM